RPTPELFAALGQPVPERFAASGAGQVPSGATGTAGASADAGAAAQRSPEQRAQFRPQRGADATSGGFGRVWVMRGGALQPLRVQTGVSDGAMTAVVNGDLKEGDQVVTGISDQASVSTSGASPLLPFGRRGGGAGANRPAAGGAPAPRAGGAGQ